MRRCRHRSTDRGHGPHQADGTRARITPRAPTFAPDDDAGGGLPRQSISKQLIKQFKLDAGKSAPKLRAGLQGAVAAAAGTRATRASSEHALGWPADGDTYGGSFLYHLDNDRVYVGYVVGLDYQDPRLQPFEAFQQYKNHPSVKPLLEGGEILAAGARTIAAGGWQSLPTLEMPGALLIGDAGGTLNLPRSRACTRRSAAACSPPSTRRARHPRASMRAGAPPRRPGAAQGAQHQARLQARHVVGSPTGRWETLTAGHTPWTLQERADCRAAEALDAYHSPDAALGRAHAAAARPAVVRCSSPATPR
jgi:electron-transferring-flavoprotein dehydrogenase